MSDTIQDVTIVGGGFAGLAAALRLLKAGARIQVVEKRPFFGGRAYSFRDPQTGEWVDNGQHLLMGAYRETLEFLRELGTFDRLDVQEKLGVTMASREGSHHRLRCPRLPAPLHLGVALLQMSGLSWRDKARMLNLVRTCRRSDAASDLDSLSVRDFLSRCGQTEAAIRLLWEPITLATLNEPLSQASAELFREVLARSLLSSDTFDSRMILPKVSFQELYAEPARKYLEARKVPIFFQSQLTDLEKSDGYFSLHLSTGRVLKSKKVLLAVPPDALGKISGTGECDLSRHFPRLDRFQGSPIISIHLWFKGEPRDRRTGLLGEKFVGLIDSPIHWIFDKTLMGEAKESYLSMVISGAYELAVMSQERLLALALDELAVYYPGSRAMTLARSRIVKEYKATYSGRLGLGRYRPSVTSPVEGLYLAGDWIDTKLPATIESAVMSGHQAARALLEY